MDTRATHKDRAAPTWTDLEFLGVLLQPATNSPVRVRERMSEVKRGREEGICASIFATEYNNRAIIQHAAEHICSMGSVP